MIGPTPLSSREAIEVHYGRLLQAARFVELDAVGRERDVALAAWDAQAPLIPRVVARPMSVTMRAAQAMSDEADDLTFGRPLPGRRTRRR